MRLSDRLFAYWRMPAWEDRVQVLLWLMGWAMVALFLVSVARQVAPLLGSMRDFPAFSDRLLLVLAVMIAGWVVSALFASWCLSEAYGGWRSGHPHGRQWSLLIAVLLLVPLPIALFGGLLDAAASSLANIVVAVETALGLTLLLMVLTTKMPERPAGASPTT